jgi:hypothetical protein
VTAAAESRTDADSEPSAAPAPDATKPERAPNILRAQGLSPDTETARVGGGTSNNESVFDFDVSCN